MEIFREMGSFKETEVNFVKSEFSEAGRDEREHWLEEISPAAGDGIWLELEQRGTQV